MSAGLARAKPPPARVGAVAPSGVNRLAEVAVTRLLSPAWSGRVVQAVHGPTDLTWAQAAEIVSAATGQPCTVERISDETMRENLRSSGMTARLTDAVIDMSTGLRDDFVPEQPRTIRTTTPTTLAAWAYDVLRTQL